MEKCGKKKVYLLVPGNKSYRLLILSCLLSGLGLVFCCNCNNLGSHFIAGYYCIPTIHASIPMPKLLDRQLPMSKTMPVSMEAPLQENIKDESKPVAQSLELSKKEVQPQMKQIKPVKEPEKPVQEKSLKDFLSDDFEKFKMGIKEAKKEIVKPVKEKVEEENQEEKSEAVSPIIIEQKNSKEKAVVSKEGGHQDQHDNHEHHHHDKNAYYKFEYSVNDKKTKDIKHQKEELRGDKVEGEYSLVEEDGNIRTVKYTADWKNGFRAKVHNSKKKPFQ